MLCHDLKDHSLNIDVKHFYKIPAFLIQKYSFLKRTYLQVWKNSVLTNIKFRYVVIVIYFILWCILRVAFFLSHNYTCFKMLMSEPLFDVLRTKEQLGYHVYNILRYTYGILGFSVTVICRAEKYRYINCYWNINLTAALCIYVHCCSVLYMLQYQIMMQKINSFEPLVLRSSVVTHWLPLWVSVYFVSQRLLWFCDILCVRFLFRHTIFLLSEFPQTLRAVSTRMLVAWQCIRP